MGLRKASAYSKEPVLPYTRTSRVKGKSFIKAVPPQKIVKFTMGDEGAFNKGKFPIRLTVIATENCQIRNNALEACRQYINKELDTQLPGQYLFKVIPYPHHIQREHRMLTGAGADRMSTGMGNGGKFGKAMGKAAIVKDGSRIFFLAIANQKAEAVGREILKTVNAKLPCRKRILTEVVK